MSTISKEAREAAHVYLAINWSTQDTLEAAFQSLLDAQKAESENVIAQLKKEYAQQGQFLAKAWSQCETLEGDTKLIAAAYTKATATITELRAACAELSFKHLGSCDGLLLEFTDGTKLNPNIPDDGYALADRIKKALSSHGESLLSELAELRRINNTEYTEAGWFRAKELEAELKAKDEEVKRLASELEHVRTMHELRGKAMLLLASDEEVAALRARAESAETLVKQLESVQVLQPQPLESAAAVKEQGDKV